MLAWLLPLSVQAVPVTYDFQGEIGSFSLPGIFIFLPTDPVEFPLNLQPGLNGGPSLLGQIIRGSITLDADAGVDQLPQPDRGRYTDFGAISAFSLSLNGFDFALDTNREGALATALVSNIAGRPTDFLTFAAGLAPGSFAGVAGEDYLINLRLSFTTPDLNVINSDRIPNDLTPLRNGWATSIFFTDPLTGTFVGYNASFADVSKRAAISTTGTSLLFGIGTLVMAVAVARRRCPHPLA